MPPRLLKSAILTPESLIECQTGIFSWCVISWFLLSVKREFTNYSSGLVSWRFCVTCGELEWLTDIREFIWNNSYLYCGCRWKWRVIIAIGKKKPGKKFRIRTCDLRDTVEMYSFSFSPRRRFVFQMPKYRAIYCTCFNFAVVLFPFLSSPWGSVYRFLYSIFWF